MPQLEEEISEAVVTNYTIGPQKVTIVPYWYQKKQAITMAGLYCQPPTV